MGSDVVHSVPPGFATEPALCHYSLLSVLQEKEKADHLTQLVFPYIGQKL